MKKSLWLAIAFLCLSSLSFGQGGTGGGGGGGNLAPTTVAKLPVSPTVGTVYSVKDGNSVTDCSVGSGTTGVVCLWTGSVWTAIGSAAGTGANTALSNLVSPTPEREFGACSWPFDWQQRYRNAEVHVWDKQHHPKPAGS